MHTLFRTLLACLWLIAASAPALAQEAEPSEPSPIAAGAVDDTAIEDRLTAIFAEISGLEPIEVSVEAGVVTLSGSVASAAEADRAAALAERLEGVVAVEDETERNLRVDQSISPALADLRASVNRGIEALPLMALGLAVFLVIAILGHLLGAWTWLWRRVTPNPFLAELVGQAVRFVAIVVGLVMALNLVGATALMGAILGGAGVIGLAIGFAVRDTVENYISSIMLSLRQPFRANDHVLINEHEGKVVRLTSRATILMTLDGNHLRVPNSTVFKGIILNYTRNPERRFEFDLGVDANDDPVAAMATGLAAISALDFVLTAPKPDAMIVSVGDSNIVIRFLAWVNQDDAEFHKGRSLAIRAAKDALETEGFTLPEPIYRLRFDGGVPPAAEGTVSQRPAGPAKPVRPPEAARASVQQAETDIMDVRPENTIDEKVAEERAQTGENDLLDPDRPVE